MGKYLTVTPVDPDSAVLEMIAQAVEVAMDEWCDASLGAFRASMADMMAAEARWGPDSEQFQRVKKRGEEQMQRLQEALIAKYQPKPTP